MSRFDRVMARRTEAIVKRRAHKEGTPGIDVLKQHRQGARWWREKSADIAEKRRSSRQGAMATNFGAP